MVSLNLIANIYRELTIYQALNFVFYLVFIPILYEVISLEPVLPDEENKNWRS